MIHSGAQKSIKVERYKTDCDLCLLLKFKGGGQSQNFWKQFFEITVYKKGPPSGSTRSHLPVEISFYKLLRYFSDIILNLGISIEKNWSH